MRRGLAAFHFPFVGATFKDVALVNLRAIFVI